MKPTHIFDAASVGIAAASFAGWLPPIAAIFSIIWCVIQISESQRWLQFRNWVKARWSRNSPTKE